MAERLKYRDARTNERGEGTMTDGAGSPENGRTGRAKTQFGRRKFVRGAGAAALSLPAVFGAPAVSRAAGAKIISIWDGFRVDRAGG